MTSELNSVASITYVAMFSWALNASVSQMKHGDELSSIDLLASLQVKRREDIFISGAPLINGWRLGLES